MRHVGKEHDGKCTVKKDALRLIENLMEVEGAISYDESDSRNIICEVILPKKDGGVLRVGMEREDVDSSNGIFYDYFCYEEYKNILNKTSVLTKGKKPKIKERNKELCMDQDK